MITSRRPHHFAFPIVLILGGLLLLLASLGTLPANAGWRLLALWPLLLVVAGIDLLMPHLVQGAAVPALTVLLVAAIAVGAFAYAIGGPSTPTASYVRFQSTSPAEGRAEGKLSLDIAAAQVTITSADLGAQLYRVTIDHAGAAPRFSYADGDISITSPTNLNLFNSTMPQSIVDLKLSQSVRWTIAINGAGTDTTMNLANTTLRSVTIDAVGGKVAITAGVPDGMVAIKLSGIGTALDLTVPAGTEYRATADGLGASIAGTPQTPGWSSASNRYDISLNGIGAHASVASSS